MALITSAASGNFSAGATWTGGVVPGPGDEARASTGHTITIDVDTTCNEVSNAGTGIFTLASGVTLTANVTSKSTTTSRSCLQFTAASPAQGFIVGNCTGGDVSGAIAVSSSSTGDLYITGNILGGTGVGVNTGAIAVNCVSSGQIIITGNTTGGTANNCEGIRNSSTGVIVLVGNSLGGIGTGASLAPGIRNSSTGVVNISGIASGAGASPGVINVSTGTINVIRAKADAYGPGNTAGLTGQPGITNLALGVIEIKELEYGAYGMSPTSGTGIRLKKLGSNVAVFNYVDSGSAKTLIDATQANQPAASNVRSGVSYASGALTGTCAVPAAGSVALGVPVGSTTGTALLTQADVQAALTAQGLTTARSGNLDNLDTTVSSRLAPSGTLATVTNLTNAPASVTPSDIWGYASRTLTSASGPTAVQIRQEMDSNSTKLANLDTTVSSRLAGSAYTAPTTPPTAAAVASQVRTELGTELGRIDAAISTRATPANIPTADITAIKAKTDALNTTRLAQVSTTEIVGGLLAQANS